MTTFHYKAIGKDGQTIDGEIEATDRKFVVDQLNSLGHLAINVEEVTLSKNKGESFGSLFLFRSPPKTSQITFFTRELAVLLQAGLPLVEALYLLVRETPSSAMKKLISDIIAGLEDGQSFGDALGEDFPPTYRNMVRIAEASGSLDQTLFRIADTRERDERLRGKAISSAIYPTFLIISAIAAIALLLVYVVPRFKVMIEGAGSSAPATTKSIILLSDWLIAHGHVLLISLITTALVLLMVRTQSWFRHYMNELLQHTPVVGHVLRLNLTITFCRTLGTLLESGLELPQALKLTKGVLANSSTTQILDTAIESLRKGQSFSDVLNDQTIFPPIVINLLKVGDKSGDIAGSALHLANLFENKLEVFIQRIFSILEPVIILVVGIFVAATVISIISAVISINDLAI